MSVWKSPVLYFGVLLVLAVAAALMAPFVYDWNSYRGRLEAFGQKLTGREVKIAGGISVRLFPWPQLTADNVHIANPKGLAAPDFASAERITVRLQLAGLLNGNFQVESIDVDRPTFAIERQAGGQGNWLFEMSPDLSREDLAARVKLDRITLNDAIVHLKDDRRGTGDMEFTVPRATLMAPGLRGPWRANADNLGFDGQHFVTSVTTGVWGEGQPFRFGITVRPAAESAATLPYAVGFDGESDQGKLSGELRLDPAAGSDGRGNAEGAFRPLAITAKVKGDFDTLDVSDLQVTPADPKQGGPLFTGSGHVDLGKQIAAAVDLTATKLDLASIAGAEFYAALRQGGVLAAADALLATLPEDVQLSGSLHVAALDTQAETLENIALKMDAGREAIRVQEATASLPGRSRALFKGVFFPGKAGAELAGTLALEANDTRAFSMWLWPQLHDRLAAVWAGSRGHFKLQSDVNLTESALRLSKAQYEMDSVPGTFALEIAQGGRGTVDLRLDAGKLDVDNITGGHLPALGSGHGVVDLLPALLPQRDSPDLRLVVQSDELLLNGVSARDVTLDMAAGGNGLDLRTLELGSVGGARLTASGLVLDSGKGADGSVGIDVQADDPRGLLRLAGLLPADRDPAWALALGKTALKGTVSVKAGSQGPQAGFDLAGNSGDFDITASGNIVGAGAGTLSGTLDLRSKTSAGMARLAGLTAAADDQLPGHLTITASPDPKGGYRADVQAQLFGLQGDFNGTLAAPKARAAGKLSLRSTDLSALIAAAGMPVTTLPKSVLVLDAAVGGDAGTIALNGINGRIGEAPLSGDLSLTRDAKLTGKLGLGDVDLADLLPPLFLGWFGTAPSSDSTFAAHLPLGLTGEVWLAPKRLAIGDGFVAEGAQIGITADADTIRLAAFGKDGGGRAATVEIASAGSDATRTIDGKLTLPVDLAQQLQLVGGGPIADGAGTIEVHTTTAGRTPGGALASLKGSGTYSFDRLKFTSISPAAFTAALANAKDAAGLTAAFDALRGPGGLDMGAARGAITIDNGIAGFFPLKVSTPDADAQAKATADLTSGELTIAVGLDLKAQGGLPHTEVSFAGLPRALTRSEDKAELANKLGIAIMQQGVAQLEKLQQEQQQLAAKEEAQRKEDEAKLAAYYAQRDELLLRKRELRVFSQVRMAAAEQLRQEIDAQRTSNAEINKTELTLRRREIRVYRKLAAADAGQPFQIDVTATPKPQSAPKPQVKPAKPAQPAQPAQAVAPAPAGPIIPVPPTTAPDQVGGIAAPSQ